MEEYLAEKSVHGHVSKDSTILALVPGSFVRHTYHNECLRAHTTIMNTAVPQARIIDGHEICQYYTY